MTGFSVASLSDHRLGGLLRRHVKGDRDAERLLDEVARRYDALRQVLEGIASVDSSTIARGDGRMQAWARRALGETREFSERIDEEPPDDLRVSGHWARGENYRR